MTNIFYDADVREILQTMAAQCFVNVIADETVHGILSVELEEVPLEEAMRRVLAPFGLTYRWMDGYYLVGSARPDNPSFPLLTETELYRPGFIKAADVPKLMSTFYEPYMRVDTDQNAVALTASPELIERMKEDLAKVDRPPRQVMIDAFVTEVSTDVSKALGISWGLTGDKKDGQRNFTLEAYDESGPRPDSSIGGIFQELGILGDDWVSDFKLRVKALAEDGKARIRANPRVATLEGQEARIFVGREEYFTIITGSVSFAYAQLEVIKTGISLTITPYVSEDGAITLEVEPMVSDVIGSGSTGLPVTSVRSVKTRIRVNRDETVVIGGLNVVTQMKNVRKIPILGSIPILGLLFSQTEIQDVESEVTVLIKPTLW
jgi:type II secretory pathway component GspD/PulD (secretin)